MTPTIRNLLALADRPEPAHPGAPARKAARAQWALEQAAALDRAQRAMTERCCEAVDRLDEQAFEQLCEAEQAKVDAIKAQLDAAAYEDKWPRELYFGGI